MIQKELCKAAAGKAVLGNKVPVWKTILAGEKVPIDVYRVEDGGRVDFNLETGQFSCRIGGGNDEEVMDAARRMVKDITGQECYFVWGE